MALGMSLKRHHESVAVDDAGRGREQRANAPDGRFELHCLRCRQLNQIINAVAGGRLLDFAKARELLIVGRDDEFFAARIINAIFLAEPVELMLAINAEVRPQAVLGIVDAGVNDLAVARTRLRTDQIMALGDDHLLARHGEGPGNGKTDHAGPYNDGLHIRRHVRLAPWMVRLRCPGAQKVPEDALS